MSKERSPLPGGERRDDGEDQQEGVGSGSQEGSSTLGLLADALWGSPHREPIPPRGVNDGDPATRYKRLPPEAQLCLLARLKVPTTQDGVPHRALTNALPAQQEQSQLCKCTETDKEIVKQREKWSGKQCDRV